MKRTSRQSQIGCLVTQEQVPFQRAIGSDSKTLVRLGSEDGEKDVEAQS